MANDGVIRILSPAVAQKIAAGEVIERPQSVVRELIDNSLDAGATSIDVTLEGGGNDLVRVADNGCGMPPEDVERCYLTHATSKIETDIDLLHIRTLGFRGEALSSMAAVSRLTVTSSVQSASPAESGHSVGVHGGKLQRSGPAPARPGTVVECRNLFYNLPARKRFLKRPASESAMVRSVVIEKALAHPSVEFRLFSNDELKLFLPAADLVERITACYPQTSEPALLHTLSATGEGFSFALVAGEPGLVRRDRKHLQIFVNGRRIWEYALVQAVEYAYRDYVHGGLYPVAYLFLAVEPELVDFNIHPAKREARFRNLAAIHHTVVETLAGHLRVFDRTTTSPIHRETGSELPHIAAEPAEVAEPAGRPQRSAFGQSGVTSPGNRAPARPVAYDLSRTLEIPDERERGFRYLGQLFGLFLVVERDDRLYLVDQHAAHEKLVYNRLRSGSAGQELLFPISFEMDAEKSEVLESHVKDLARLGVDIRRSGDDSWELVSVPAAVEIEADELIDMIHELALQPAEFERELYASMSCRAAVMDGDILSRSTAIRIIEESLDLTNARCPHGRPIWAEFSREELMKIVGRI